MFECLASYGVKPPSFITLTYDDLSHTMHESGNTTTVFKQFSAKTNCAIISLPFVHNHNIESKTNNVEKKTWKSERNRRNSLIKTRYLHAYIHTYQRSYVFLFVLLWSTKRYAMGDIEEILWGNTHTYGKLKVGWVFPQKSGWWREVAIIFVEGGWFMSIAILLRSLKGKPKRGKCYLCISIVSTYNSSFVLRSIVWPDRTGVLDIWNFACLVLCSLLLLHSHFFLW